VPRKLIFATSSVFYPDSSGGAERSNLYLFESLRRRGWEVRLVCGRSTRNRRGWRLAASSLKNLRRPGIFHRDDVNGFECWRGFQRFRDHPGWTAWFGEYLRDFAPDVVLGYNNLSCPFLHHSLARGYPAVFVVRSLANLFGVTRWVPDGVRLMAASPFVAGVAEKALGRRPDVVLPFIDSKDYRVERHDPRFITFINPMPEKGVEVALQVARSMPDRSFLFVKGRWADRSYAGLDVSEVPNVEVWEYREDVRSVYAVTEVLLVPSQWDDTHPRVVVEAQVNGIPVVASAVGGIPVEIGEGGIVVHPKSNVEAYVAALRRLEDPEQHARYSTAARANAARPEFEPEGQVDAFVAVVEDEIAARRADVVV